MANKTDQISVAGKKEVDLNMFMIEELPDEILSKIISFLPVKEAIRTSILSNRWRYLYLFRSHLNFDDTFIVYDNCSWEKEHVKSVYKLLQHYSDSRIKSFRLSVPHCLDFWRYIDDMDMDKLREERRKKRKKDYEIDDPNGSYRWIRLAIQMSAEKLNLTYLDHGYDKAFSFEILSGLLPSKLKHLRLQNCSIAKFSYDHQPVVHSLATLELEDLMVDETALETIFSTCVNLWKLVLRGCFFKGDLTIASDPSISNLKCLQIFSSMHLELEKQRVHPYPNPKPKLSFSNVPKLEEIRLDLDQQRYNRTVDELFITGDAPQLKRLTTVNMPTIFKLDPKLEPQIPMSMLCQLEQLELILDIKYYNLLNMIPHVLLACPLLQKFHLTASGQLSKISFVVTACSSRHPFPNLKQVKIRTFYGRCGNPFVFYLLENVVALERIILDTTSCHHELCKLKHMSHQLNSQQIRARVASPTVKLVFHHHSNEGIDFTKIFLR